MTTIAVRNGVMAADSRSTVNEAIVEERTAKIYKLPNGDLIGISGAHDEGLYFLEQLKKNKVCKTRNITAILLKVNGEIHVYEGTQFFRTSAPYHAIGSGWKFALGAMDYGASAKEAVDIAKRRDIYTGGRTVVLRLRRQYRRKKCRSRK